MGVQGPQGPTGAAGAQGPQGPTFTDTYALHSPVLASGSTISNSTTDAIFFIDVTGANGVVTLPPANSGAGKYIMVARSPFNSANSLTVQTQLSDRIFTNPGNAGCPTSNPQCNLKSSITGVTLQTFISDGVSVWYVQQN